MTNAKVAHHLVEAAVNQPDTSANVYHHLVETVVTVPEPEANVYHHLVEAVVANLNHARVFHHLVETVVKVVPVAGYVSGGMVASSLPDPAAPLFAIGPG